MQGLNLQTPVECSICRGECSSEHADVPLYLRPEMWEKLRQRSYDRVITAVKYAETKAKAVASAA